MVAFEEMQKFDFAETSSVYLVIRHYLKSGTQDMTEVCSAQFAASLAGAVNLSH